MDAAMALPRRKTGEAADLGHSGTGAFSNDHATAGSSERFFPSPDQHPFTCCKWDVKPGFQEFVANKSLG